MSTFSNIHRGRIEVHLICCVPSASAPSALETGRRYKPRHQREREVRAGGREGEEDARGTLRRRRKPAKTGGTSEPSSRENSSGPKRLRFGDRRRTMDKLGKIFKEVYYDQFKWSVVKNIAFFIVGVKIAVECNGMTPMPPVSV